MKIINLQSYCYFFGKRYLEFGDTVFGLRNNCGLMNKSIKLGLRTETFDGLITDKQCGTKQGICSLCRQPESHDTRALCLTKEQ